jgi:hypothetical protein
MISRENTVSQFKFLCGWLKHHILEVDKHYGPGAERQRHRLNASDSYDRRFRTFPTAS